MDDNVIDTNKSVLIASDIFGMSEAFISLLEDTTIAHNTIAISPYQQGQIGFENEQQAYQYFQNHGGIDAYILSITDVLKSHAGITQVIAFSAGAAAVYKVVSNLPIQNLELTLFYPSQIRHFLDKHPSCQCHIILPESEPHFSVPDVIKVLKQQSNIQVEQNTYQHGFMNKDSNAFDQTAYHYYCQTLKMWLTKK
jgi:hypothetical protein